jgi:segregation and condensation protein B
MNLKAELEALLFATDQPLSIARLQEVVPRGEKADVQAALEELERDYQDGARAFRLLRVAGGFQLATKQEYADVVRRLFVGKRRVRLTKAALEVLAIIAYKQPTTRPEIDAIRGVSSGGVLETLLERNLVRIAGRAEGVGRPLLYATTPEFLQYLGLNRVRDLPSLVELETMLAEREEEMRHEEEEELRALAEAGEPTSPEDEEEAPAPTLEDKLRAQNLPTLDELDVELDEKRTQIEEVAVRVDAERRSEPQTDDPAESAEQVPEPLSKDGLEPGTAAPETPPAGDSRTPAPS